MSNKNVKVKTYRKRNGTIVRTHVRKSPKTSVRVAPYKKRKTVETQGLRKVEGTIAEKLVKDELSEILGSRYEFSISSNKGIDIYGRDGQILNVEVKSAKEKTFYKYKGGHSTRSGRFVLKESDYLDSDFFGFVIKKVDSDLKWTGKTRTVFVDTKEVQNFLKNNGKFRTCKSVKLTIKDVCNFPNLNLNKYA